MKKIILVLLLIGFLVVPNIALGSEADPIQPLPEVPFLAALGWVVNFVFYIFATAAVVFIIVAAFQFLTAGGNTDTIAKARTSILYAVIAIVLAVMAMGIVTFIREQLDAL